MNFTDSSEYQALFDVLPLMYFVVDDAGRILTVNQAGADTLGYAREELLQTDVLGIFVEEDRDRVREQIAQCRNQPDRIAQWEFRKKRKDGSTLWVRETVRPAPHPDGGMVYHIICEDITDNKQMLEQLQYAEVKYRTLVEKVPAISYAVELGDNPQTTFISPQVEFLLGYTPEEWLSDPEFWHQCIHPEDCDRVREEVLRNNETGAPFFLEYRTRTKKGQYRWLRNHGVYMRDESGTPRYTHGVMIDITDTKQIEEREKEVQDRLMRAERMEAIGVLAGGVAHDLNNLLGPLVGYPDLIGQKLPTDHPANEELRAMRDSALRASDIIQDLLTLSRRSNAPQEPVNVNHVIRSYMGGPAYRTLRERHPLVDVAVRLDPDIPRVRGSAAHLLQLIMNLVQNAFEAISGRGRISVSTNCEFAEGAVGRFDTLAGGAHVVLRVQDTGCGIAQQELERVFEPFYTHKGPGGKGTGLGLSIVYGIVKDMQGAVDLESTPGKGSTFTLYMPVCAEGSTDQTDATTDARLDGKERLLVVDDVAEQRELAHRILSNLGYRVHAVSGQDDALSAMQSNTYDLVVLDMIIQDGPDGLDTYKEILKVAPKQRCILISGYAETERVHEAQRLGAHSYVRKPYTMETLGKAVRAALDQPAPAH